MRNRSRIDRVIPKLFLEIILLLCDVGSVENEETDTSEDKL